MNRPYSEWLALLPFAQRESALPGYQGSCNAWRATHRYVPHDALLALAIEREVALAWRLAICPRPNDGLDAADFEMLDEAAASLRTTAR